MVHRKLRLSVQSGQLAFKPIGLVEDNRGWRFRNNEIVTNLEKDGTHLRVVSSGLDQMYRGSDLVNQATLDNLVLQ